MSQQKDRINRESRNNKPPQIEQFETTRLDYLTAFTDQESSAQDLSRLKESVILKSPGVTRVVIPSEAQGPRPVQAQ